MSQSNLVSLAVQDGVGVITVNNPPVNALSPGVPEGITTCLAAAIAVAALGAAAQAITPNDGNRRARPQSL